MRAGIYRPYRYKKPTGALLSTAPAKSSVTVTFMCVMMQVKLWNWKNMPRNTLPFFEASPFFIMKCGLPEHWVQIVLPSNERRRR